MSHPIIHIVGFGSQGSAWAQCLRTSGWNVQVYLGSRESRSFQKAAELDFKPKLLSDLATTLNSSDPAQTHWIATLCPDTIIGSIYRDFIAPSPATIRIILAHGFAVYSGDLKPKSPLHEATLLAPKAIGPKLLENFNKNFPSNHDLSAALCCSEDDQAKLRWIAKSLGFDSDHLIPATFEQETIGDLISEQGLLCGGIFNLLLMTFEAMARAGVPDALIREECLTELELMTGMLRRRGPADTFRAISQAAQAGTIAMEKQLEAAEFEKFFEKQTDSVTNGEFIRFFKSDVWRRDADELIRKFQTWDERFSKLSKEKK